jgi:hypothetical protein
MNTFIICGTLALILFVTLLYQREYFTNPSPAELMVPGAEPMVPGAEPMLLTEPQNFSDESLLRSVIPNAPAPAGTDQTEKLMYSNTDLEANIVDIKKKIDLVNMNMPEYVRQEVASQLVAQGQC